MLGLLALVLQAGYSNGQVIAGWDVNGLSGYGTSPLTATTAGTNVEVGGLTRGTGVTTTGTAAANAWGGANWISTTQAAAITANRFATFTVSAKRGYKLSVDSLVLNYRRSSTGATNGQLQYSLDGTTYVDVPGGSLNYSSSSSSGALLPTINLSAIAALHNVADCKTITFRIVNWGASGAAGTWYVYNRVTGNDLVVYGNTSVAPVHYAVTTISPASPSTGSAFSVDVVALDTTGALSNVAGTSAFVLSTNGAAGTIGGVTSGNIASGSNTTTVSGITLSGSGAGATITATAVSGDCLTSGTSALFTVSGANCSGNPGAGSIAASTSVICGSGTTTLTLTPSSAAPGITYQWLESSTGSAGTFTEVAGATNTTYVSGTISSNIYYQAVTTCSFSGLSDTTTDLEISVNTLPTAAIFGSATIVGGTSTTLTFSGDPLATVTYNINGSGSYTIALDATGAASLVVSPSVTSVYSVVSVTSAAGCVSPISGSSATVDVIFSFTAGNLVVFRADGTSNSATGITLVQYDNNTPNQTSPVSLNVFPTSGTGRLVCSGAATSEGQMTLDAERTHLIVPGYDASIPTSNISTASGINRAIYSISLFGSPVLAASVSDSLAFQGSNIRSATASGSNYFATGNSSNAVTAGIQFLGGSVSSQLCSTTTNTRVVNIFNGQLYYSTATGTGLGAGIYAVGTGIPTTSTTATQLIATGSSTSPYGFSISPDGQTAYIADDASTTTKGIQKWVLSGSSWTMAYRLAANAGARSVAVDYSKLPYIVYATTASGSATTPDTLIKIVDSNATAVYYNLATSPAGTSFRGVTFAPSCFVSMSIVGDSILNVGDSTTIRFYGNPGATIAFTVNGGSLQTIVLGANGEYYLNTGALAASQTYVLDGISTSVCDNEYVEGTITVKVNNGNGNNRQANSINTTSKNTINIYPNPAHDVININSNEAVNVSIYSVDGKQVLSSNNTNSINVSNLTNGIYIIKVYNLNNELINTSRFNKN